MSLRTGGSLAFIERAAPNGRPLVSRIWRGQGRDPCFGAPPGLLAPGFDQFKHGINKERGVFPLPVVKGFERAYLGCPVDAK